MDFGLGLGLGIVIGLFMAGGLFVLLEMMERPRPPTSTQPSGPTTARSECWMTPNKLACQHPSPRDTDWGPKWCPDCGMLLITLRPSGAWDTSTPEGG